MIALERRVAALSGPRPAGAGGGWPGRRWRWRSRRCPGRWCCSWRCRCCFWLLDGTRRAAGGLRHRLGGRRGALRGVAVLDRRSVHGASPRSSAGWRRSRSSAWRAGWRCSGRCPSRWRGRGGRRGVGRVLVLAALWTLAEYARGHVLTGFPWGLVGLRLGRDAGDPGGGAVRAVHARAPDARRGAAARARDLAGGRRWPRRWWRRAGASAPGGWRSRCRSGRSRWWCGWCSRTRAQELKWQPGMEQAFYDRHIALTGRRRSGGRT